MKYLAALLVTSVLALVGCNDGPAEEFGEDIDEMSNDAGNAVEDAADDVEDSIEN